MILLINTCKEKLHYSEFVKPVEDILRRVGVKFSSRPYKEVKSRDLEKCDQVIICGTSLKDFDYIKNIKKFEWVKNFDKPILGICAGMQIIGSVFGGKSIKPILGSALMSRKTEIGFYQEDFKQNFLGLEDKQGVYHLHNNFIEFRKLKDFEIFTEGNGVPQAVKHKEKEIYGVLFHPEVRQKELIKNFAAKLKK